MNGLMSRDYLNSNTVAEFIHHKTFCRKGNEMNVTFLKLNEINSRLIEAALDTPFSYEWLFNHSELGKTLLTMKTTTQEPTVEGGKVITVWCEKPPHLSHHKWSHEQEIVHKLHIGGYFRISHKKNGEFVSLEWKGL